MPSYIKAVQKNLSSFDTMVDLAIDSYTSLNSIIKIFVTYLTQTMNVEISNRLYNWPEIEFIEFIKEINK